MKLIYEVRVSLPSAAKDQALEYMCKHHIKQVISHPAFSGASFFVVDSEEPEKFKFVTQYAVKDETALTAYLERDSAPLRADFVNNFGHYKPIVERAILRRHADL